MAVTTNNQYIATASYLEENLKIWDLNTGELKRVFCTFPNCTKISFAHNNEWILSVTDEKKYLMINHIESKNLLTIFEGVKCYDFYMKEFLIIHEETSNQRIKFTLKNYFK